MNPKIFKDKLEELNAIKDDTSARLENRIFALTEKYFLLRGDVHQQAQAVREIEYLVRGVKQ